MTIPFNKRFLRNLSPICVTNVKREAYYVKEILSAFNYISLTALSIIGSVQMKPETKISQEESNLILTDDRSLTTGKNRVCCSVNLIYFL